MQHLIFYKKWLFYGLICLFAGKMTAQPNWSLNPAQFQFNMIVTAQLYIGGTPSHASGNIVAVYAGDELRGVAVPVVVNGQAFYFLTVYAHTYATDTLTFKAYIAAADAIYTSPDSVVFKHNAHLGKISAPHPLHFELAEAPQIYSSHQIFFQENTCFELHDVQALDNENSEGNGLIYSLNGGGDAGKFSIDPVTGKLEFFNFTPDFEAPADANSDNVYEVKIKVEDQDGYFSTQNLRVAMTDNTAESFDPQITGNLTLCPGELSTLQVSEGAQFLWNNGETSAVLTDVGPGAYSVTVTNAGACTAIRSANVQSNEVNGGNVGSNQVLCPGSNDPAPFTSAIAGTGAGVLTYRWELGTGSCSGGFSPIANAVDEAYDVPPGLAQTTFFRRIAVSTLNGYVCESPSNCVTVTLLEIDNQAPVALCKNISVSLDASGNASITASDIDNGSSDNCTLGILTVSPNTFNTTNLGANTVTLNVPDTGGNTSTCTATVTVTPYSFSISGTIIWENDDVTGVGNATVALTGHQSGSVITPAAGTYSFTLTSGSNFTVTPSKTINKLNGVTTADATRIQQHVANSNPITDLYKIVAADVNKSNSVTSQDASIINQALLGNPAALAQFKTSWRFVPQSHVLNNPPWGFPENISMTGVSTNQTGKNFFGIKTGDVATTWANPANFGSGEPLVLRVQDRWLETGAEVVAEFHADQLNDLSALQMALRFDPAYLELTSIDPLSGLALSSDNFGTFDVASGEIRVVWSAAAPASLDEAAPLFRLRFKILSGGALLGDVLHLDTEALPAHAYNSALAESGVELHFSETTQVGTNPGLPSMWMYASPNPFKYSTTLHFELPEAGEAELRVHDTAGRLLFSMRKYYSAGIQKELLELDESAVGVLFVELLSSGEKVTRRLIHID